jgi:hypothetical protein
MEDRLHFDIRRSLILQNYIQVWGVPTCRFTREADASVVEIYFFESIDNSGEDSIIHVATVGISSCFDQGEIASEMFVVVSSSYSEATAQELCDLMISMSEYSRKNKGKVVYGETIDVINPIPSKWNAKSILICEPFGEPEELSVVNFNNQKIEIRWLLPIFSDEVSYIRKNGMIALFDLFENSEISIAEPTRGSILS